MEWLEEREVGKGWKSGSWEKAGREGSGKSMEEREVGEGWKRMGSCTEKAGRERVGAGRRLEEWR